MKVLLLATKTQAIKEYEQYSLNSDLPWTEITYLIEFHDQVPPDQLPRNCIVISDFADSDAVATAMPEVDRRGPFDAVIAYDEVATLTAAKIRGTFNLPGMTVQQALRFRDKVIMKHVLRAKGLRVPREYSLQDLMNGQYKLPLICKPRSLAGSEGVSIIRDFAALMETAAAVEKAAITDRNELDPNDLHFEEFISGPIFHIDGVVQHGDLVFCSTSAYIGTCLSNLAGEPLASHTLPPGEHLHAWTNYAAQVVKAMEMPDGVFHLEAFLPKHGERTFLEVGLRPGGGLVVPSLRKTRGIDLQLIHLQAQLQIPFKVEVRGSDLSGFVMLPKNSGLDQAIAQSILSFKKEGVEAATNFGSDNEELFTKSSQNIGEILFTAPNWQDIADCISRVLAGIRLERRQLCLAKK